MLIYDIQGHLSPFQKKGPKFEKVKYILKAVCQLFHIWIWPKVHRYIGHVIGQFLGLLQAVKLTSSLFDTL